MTTKKISPISYVKFVEPNLMITIIPNFKPIRLAAINQWYSGLERTRSEDENSDYYGDSIMCKIQDSCTQNGKHCSFICSLGDWLDNVSDILQDTRFDNCTFKKYDPLFRYYTRLLLVISEIIEDFVSLHKQVIGRSKKDSGNDLEKNILSSGEISNLSNFINSVCKHKTENDNLHVHNHHLTLEFEDFGFTPKINQINLANIYLANYNKETSILIPKLKYFLGLVIIVYKKIFELINNNESYKKTNKQANT